MRFPAGNDDASRKQRSAQYERDFSALRPSIGTVTLTNGATSTTLADAKLRPTRAVLLVPNTAAAAAELATLYLDTPTQGQVVIHHSNAATTRTFTYVIAGT
jgi:hypothetical protein